VADGLLSIPIVDDDDFSHDEGLLGSTRGELANIV
jgi:hypothetical protein